MKIHHTKQFWPLFDEKLLMIWLNAYILYIGVDEAPHIINMIVEVWTLRAGIEDNQSWNSMINREFLSRPSRGWVTVQKCSMICEANEGLPLYCCSVIYRYHAVEVKDWDVKEAAEAFIAVRVSVYTIITPSWLNS